MMKNFVIVMMAAFAGGAQAQTSLDQTQPEREMSAAIFAHPPVSSVVAPAAVPAVTPAGIRLASGVVVSGSVVRVIPEQVEIRTAYGLTQIPTSSLNILDCEKMLPASQWATILRLVEKEAAAGAASPTPMPTPAATPSAKPLHDGLNIMDFDAKVVSSEDEYSRVGWKVELFNNSDDPIEGLRVMFSFRGKDGIEIFDDSENDVTIRPHEKQTVTSTTFVKDTDWDQVDSFYVRTQIP